MLKKASIIFISINIVAIEITSAVHVDIDNPEVLVTFSGHSEVNDKIPVKKELNKEPIPDTYKPDNHIPDTHIPDTNIPETKNKDRTEDDVVFVPNETVLRDEDEYLENDKVRISDIVSERNLNIHDMVRGEGATTKTTEAANEDIVFISGKNKDYDHETNERTKKKERKTKPSTKTQEKGVNEKKMNCSHLDCDNVVQPLCGMKTENGGWKFRLFLNECFFRKVNCGFKYQNNRYKKTSLKKCDHIGAHTKTKPVLPVALPLTGIRGDTRQVFSSRRSLNVDINGLSCSHQCPMSCTEKYEPQCAVSSAGELKTFLNHCKLDYQSCLHNVAWQIRPLSECVGGRKADMRQNRGFIAWMQKVGIVDNRGRLRLS